MNGKGGEQREQAWEQTSTLSRWGIGNWFVGLTLIRMKEGKFSGLANMAKNSAVC